MLVGLRSEAEGVPRALGLQSRKSSQVFVVTVDCASGVPPAHQGVEAGPAAPAGHFGRGDPLRLAVEHVKCVATSASVAARRRGRVCDRPARVRLQLLVTDDVREPYPQASASARASAAVSCPAGADTGRSSRAQRIKRQHEERRLSQREPVWNLSSRPRTPRICGITEPGSHTALQRANRLAGHGA